MIKQGKIIEARPDFGMVKAERFLPGFNTPLDLEFGRAYYFFLPLPGSRIFMAVP